MNVEKVRSRTRERIRAGSQRMKAAFRAHCCGKHLHTPSRGSTGETEEECARHQGARQSPQAQQSIGWRQLMCVPPVEYAVQRSANQRTAYSRPVCATATSAV